MFGLLFQIVHGGRKHLFVVLDGGNALPLIELAQLESSRVVQDGRWVCAKERLEAGAVRQRRRARAERQLGTNIGNSRAQTLTKQHP